MKKFNRSIDYRKPFRIEIVNNERNNVNKKGTSCKSNEIISNIPVNLMEKEELHEKHLQEAIKHKSSIPVPDIVEIDEEDYNKLYPDNYTIPKIRIMVQPNDKIVDYDVDSEDEEWLNENGEAVKLSCDDFEMYIDYLESNSAENKQVPSFNDMAAHFKKCDSLLALEATYDYWLNKRLNLNGKSLVYNLKKEEPKAGVKNKHDPYIAFRPCRERMHLRKNRSRDYENYIKMLKIRRSIEESLKFYKTNAFCETAKHELLKLRFTKFIDQYRAQNFDSSYLEKETAANTEFLLKDLQENRIGIDITIKSENEIKAEDSDDSPIDVDEYESDMFTSNRRTDCEYYNIRNDYFDQNYIPECEKHEMFHNTTMGVMRRRVGRGGRIIYDRINTPNSDSALSDNFDFQEVDYLKKISVKRIGENGEMCESPRSSPFHLDSATVDPNITLDDIEIICSFGS